MLTVCLCVRALYLCRGRRMPALTCCTTTWSMASWQPRSLQSLSVRGKVFVYLWISVWEVAVVSTWPCGEILDVHWGRETRDSETLRESHAMNCILIHFCRVLASPRIKCQDFIDCFYWKSVATTRNSKWFWQLQWYSPCLLFLFFSPINVDSNRLFLWHWA